MAADDLRSDEQLLAATAEDPEAFAAFYRRHLPALVQFLLARTGSRELAVDLGAETFAAALAASGRYDARRASARTWLYAIARNKLADSLRRGRVEDRARRALRMQPIELTDADLERVEQLAARGRGAPLLALVAELPDDTRHAVSARVVDEREYGDIAGELRCSESVVRKRVSRGLAVLRQRIEEGA